MKRLVPVPRWGVAVTVSVLVHLLVLVVLVGSLPLPSRVTPAGPLIRAELVSRPVQPDDAIAADASAAPDDTNSQPPSPPSDPDPTATPEPPLAQAAPEVEPANDATAVTTQEAAEPPAELGGDVIERPLNLALPANATEDAAASLARLYRPERAPARRSLGEAPPRAQPGEAYLGMRRWEPTRFAGAYRSLEARNPYQAFVEDTPVIGPILGMFNSGPVTNPNCPEYMKKEDCQSPFSSSLDRIDRVPGTTSFGAGW